MKPAKAAPDGSGGIQAMPPDCLPPPRPSSRFAYGLRPDLHVCRLDSATIFLDIETDRYFALTGKPAETFWRLYTAENLTPAGSGSSHAASQELAGLDLVRHTSGPHACSTDLICVRLPSDQPMTGADSSMALAI